MSKQVKNAGANARSAPPAVPSERWGAVRPWVMLGLATVGFAVNFWAWALLSPLGPKFKDVLHLSPLQQALVVAVPVVVVDFGYTEIPPNELGGDRLIGHFDALVPAIDELLPAWIRTAAV